jgi:hypothetical protein
MKLAFAGLLSLAASVLALPGAQRVLPWDDKSVYEKHTIKAKGIEASFIEYGAVITNLWVNDKNGVMRDVILGWDDTTQYNVNPQHPYFGGTWTCLRKMLSFSSVLVQCLTLYAQLLSADTLTVLRMELLKSITKSTLHQLMNMASILCTVDSLALTV